MPWNIASLGDAGGPGLALTALKTGTTGDDQPGVNDGNTGDGEPRLRGLEGGRALKGACFVPSDSRGVGCSGHDLPLVHSAEYQ